MTPMKWQKIKWGEDIDSALTKIRNNRAILLKNSPAKFQEFLERGLQDLEVCLESCKHNDWVGEVFEESEFIKRGYHLIYEKVQELHHLFTVLKNSLENE